MKSILSSTLAYWRTSSGSGALEFALVLPILLLMLCGVIETTRYIQFQQRLSDTCDKLVNIVNQYNILNMGDITALQGDAQIMMSPYTTTDLTIFVTEVEQTSDPSTTKADVLWQEKLGTSSATSKVTSGSFYQNGQANTVCTTFNNTAPNNLGCTPTLQMPLAQRNQVTVVEVYLTYKPLISASAFTQFGFGNTQNYKISIATPRFGSFQTPP